MLHTLFEPLNALFIHIPKCGGGTILRTLESHIDAPNSYKSKTKKDYRRALVEQLGEKVGAERAARYARGHEPWSIKRAMLGDEKLASLFKFAFVRNPYDRLYSAFHGYAKKQNSFFSRKKPELVDINAFVEQKLNAGIFVDGTFDERCLDEETLFIHFLPQAEFLGDNGESHADFLGRMESFDHDVQQLYQRLGLENVQEVTRHIDYRGDLTAPSRYLERFSADSIAKVNRLYAKDFALLGYDQAGS